MFEIVVLSTKGDRITDRSLSEIGGKGLFTEEIEAAAYCRANSISPCIPPRTWRPTLPDGLEITAYLPREDIRDAFVSRMRRRLIELPHGAMVGTASLRRQALVRKLRPDLQVKIFRGQVETRLRKLAEGEADATLLAYAGLKRLGKPEVATEILDPEDFPAGAGAGCDLHREPHRRCQRCRRAARAGQRSADLRRRHLRARLPRSARRLLPHADRRLCASAKATGCASPA